MKFTTYLSMALAGLNGASAFVPQQSSVARPAVVPFMSEESSAEAGGKIVAIKEETVEFTAGLIGGVAGFVVGGPVLGAVGAAAANYVSKSEDEAGEIGRAVSKSALEVYNYLATLDNKYEVLASAQSSLEGAPDKLKSQEKVDSAAVEKVESALASTKAKIDELNEEYQLTDKAKTALSSAVDKAKEAAAKA